MRTLFILLFLSAISFNVHAVEPVDEQQLMLYYEIPIGAGDKKHDKHQFGLRLDNTNHEPGADVHINELYRKNGALDFRMGYDGVESIKVHGVDYTSYLIAKAAAGEGEEAVEEPAVEEVPAEAAPADTAAPEAEAAPAEAEAADTAPAETAQTPAEDSLKDVPVGVYLGVILGVLIFAGAGG